MDSNSKLSQDAGPVIKALKMTRNGSQIGSAVTSIAIIWIISYNKFLEFLPYWAAMFMGVFVVALALAILELGLRTFLPFAFDELLTRRYKTEATRKKKNFRFVFLLFCAILCTLLAFGTASTSWLGRIDMMAAATPPPKVANLDSLRLDQDAFKAATLKDYDQRIAEAQSTKAARVKAAKAQAAAWLKEAKASKGQKMASLAANGNGWAQLQIQKAVDKAKAQGDELIAMEQAKVDDLRKQKDLAFQGIQQDHRRTFDKINGQVIMTTENFESKFERNTLMLGVFGVGCLVLFLIVSLMLSIYRVINDEPTFAERAQGRGFQINLPSFNMPQVAMAGGGYQPKAQAPIGFHQTGSFSPKVTAKSGNFSPKATAFDPSPPPERKDGPIILPTESTHHGPPDNTGKTYGKRRDVAQREIDVRREFENLQTILGHNPTALQVAKNTGIGEKTVRGIINRLGLKN